MASSDPVSSQGPQEHTDAELVSMFAAVQRQRLKGNVDKALTVLLDMWDHPDPKIQRAARAALRSRFGQT
jgi:hypothetical protein